MWIGIFTVITLATCVWAKGLDGLISSMSYIAGYFFFAIFGYLMAQADENRRKTEELLVELQAAHCRLKEYAMQVEGLAVERERNHLAREVHDTLGHQLTVSVVQLEGAQRLVKSDPERAVQIIGTVRDQVKSGLRDLRRIVATLHAPEEEDSPLLLSIQKIAGQFQEATGITIDLDLPDDLPLLDQPLKLTCYRLVQEGLTNVQKHARATRVEICLQIHENLLTLTLQDNGVGLPPLSAGMAQINGNFPSEPKGGFGLLGLKERAGLVGGEFEVFSPGGQGACLTLTVPLKQG
jgi:signal transduction histidine kinase